MEPLQIQSILRDECYFDKFQRDLFITAKSHDVSEILDPTFTPGPSQEEKKLFEAKQTFMYRVFKKTLLTDMGRYKVRMHLRTTDAQALWKVYSEYMTTAYKGASEKRQLTQYVTNTVLPHAIRPRTLQDLNQRHVATGKEEDHQPHPKTMEHPTSPTDDGTTAMPDQRLVAAGGEEDHQPHSKTLKHPTSSKDDGTPNKPDIPMSS